MTASSISRRQLLKTGLYAGVAATAGRALWAAPSSEAAATIVAREPWGYLQELSEGVWAVVSTPLQSNDWTTGCNGGLIAGTERVLAVESYLRPAGARWLAQEAERLTGRWPTDVIISHFHGDHANGLEGFDSEADARVWTTRTTLDLIRAADAEGEEPPGAKRSSLLSSGGTIAENETLELDLGGRTARLLPRRGHTPSDVTVELDEPSIVFCGDLVWNGFFPNYRDTLASSFTDSIRAVRRQRPTVYVPGHGGLANAADVDTLLALVERLGEAAHRAHAGGVPAAEAAENFELPEATADWTLFNPKYVEVAFDAWYRELS